MLRLLPHLENKKHVIFDYNGTILFDTDLCVETLNLLRRSHDLQPVTQEFYLQNFHFPIANFYRGIGFDFERETFDQLGERYMNHYFQNIHRCRIYDGFRELLKALRQSSRKISILTALNQEALLEQLDHFKLSGSFDATFGLPDHRAQSKIERGRELMDHMKIAATDTIIVGDTDHDLEVAQALGTDVILLGDGHQHEDRLKKTNAPVINLQRKPEQ